MAAAIDPTLSIERGKDGERRAERGERPSFKEAQTAMGRHESADLGTPVPRAAAEPARRMLAVGASGMVGAAAAASWSGLEGQAAAGLGGSLLAAQ